MRSGWFFWGVVCALTACGGEPVSGVPDDAAAETQWAVSFRSSGAMTTVWIVVVDDAPTEAARAERARVADWIYQRGEDCSHSNDPAYVLSNDDRVVLVAASKPEQSQTSAEHPAWAPGLTSKLDPALDRARSSLSSAIAGLEADKVEPLRVWDAVGRWQALLAGQATSASAEEWRFLVDLPSDYTVVFFAAATRDDESELEPGSEGWIDNERWVVMAHVAVDNCYYQNLSPLFPRLARQGHTTCGDAPFGFVDCGVACFPAPLANWETGPDEGSVACRLTLTLDAEESCQITRGWLDPLDAGGQRRPRIVVQDGLARRVCEVRQLEGAALQSCRDDPSCAACAPGWCLRERWTEKQTTSWSVDWEGWKCDERPGDVAYEQFRLTGASDRADGELEIRCDR